MPDARRKAIDKDKLSLEIEDLLGLPRSSITFCGTGYNIVKTIFETMKQALLRGESVVIPRFGKFYLHTRPSVRAPVTYFYGNTNGPRLTIDRPAKTYVKFQPSKSLLKLINDGN